MADEKRQGEPVTYGDEVPVEKWVVDTPGELSDGLAPPRYIDAEEFKRRKAGEAVGEDVEDA